MTESITPATWTLASDPAHFDVLAQVASLKFARSGGGGRIRQGDQLFGDLLQHLLRCDDIKNLPQFLELRRVRDALAAAPGASGGGITQSVIDPATLSIPQSVGVSFREREVLLKQFNEAAKRAALAVSQIIRSRHCRAPSVIVESILSKIAPELEELAQFYLREHLRGFDTDNKLIAEKLVEALCG